MLMLVHVVCVCLAVQLIGTGGSECTVAEEAVTGDDGHYLFRGLLVSPPPTPPLSHLPPLSITLTLTVVFATQLCSLLCILIIMYSTPVTTLSLLPAKL